MCPRHPLCLFPGLRVQSPDLHGQTESLSSGDTEAKHREMKDQRGRAMKEKQNLHGVGRLVCPEGLTHWPNRIGPQAPARKADSLVGGALDR